MSPNKRKWRPRWKKSVYWMLVSAIREEVVYVVEGRGREGKNAIWARAETYIDLGLKIRIYRRDLVKPLIYRPVPDDARLVYQSGIGEHG